MMKSVRKGNPTKQGLKRFVRLLVLLVMLVRKGNPTKQGLKQAHQNGYPHIHAILVRKGNPTKQGLKLIFL